MSAYTHELIGLAQSGVTVTADGVATGNLGPISGWANIEQVDITKRWLVRVAGIDTSGGPKPITYEHFGGAVSTVGQTHQFKVKEHPVYKKPGLAFNGYLYLDRKLGAELYEVAQSMEAAKAALGEGLALSVSIDGKFSERDAIRMSDGVLDVPRMRLDSLAITGGPLSPGSDWGPGHEWLPLAASLAAQLGPLQLTRALEVLQSGVGYPTQGMGNTSAAGTELAPLVPGSIKSNQNASDSAFNFEAYILETLKVFPRMTYAEGEAATKQLLALLGQRT